MAGRTLAALALAALLPAAAAAQDGPPLDAQGFDSLTSGRTMDTETGGFLYGIEQFLPGRRVLWQDADRCVRGTWEQVGDQICFTYEDKADRPVCWVYLDRGDHIVGWLRGDRTSEPIRLTPSQTRFTCDDYLGV